MRTYLISKDKCKSRKNIFLYLRIKQENDGRGVILQDPRSLHPRIFLITKPFHIVEGEGEEKKNQKLCSSLP